LHTLTTRHLDLPAFEPCPLRTLLQQRFGALPDEVLQRIEAADIDRLNGAIAAVLTLHTLDELKL
jgi:hypothetical protein